MRCSVRAVQAYIVPGDSTSHISYALAAPPLPRRLTSYPLLRPHTAFGLVRPVVRAAWPAACVHTQRCDRAIARPKWDAYRLHADADTYGGAAAAHTQPGKYSPRPLIRSALPDLPTHPQCIAFACRVVPRVTPQCVVITLTDLYLFVRVCVCHSQVPIGQIVLLPPTQRMHSDADGVRFTLELAGPQPQSLPATADVDPCDWLVRRVLDVVQRCVDREATGKVLRALYEMPGVLTL